MAKTLQLIAVGVSISLCHMAPSAMWYVDDSVPASGGGQTWETAFKKVQEGIDAATHGDTVIVAEGLYVENIKFNGKNITLTSTDPLDPNVVQNTIIDGDKKGSVVTFSGREDETCVLSGFTIRNGRAPDQGPNWSDGGGVFGGGPDAETHATIKNNIITGNWVADDGGGLYNCDGTIRSNVISKNSASGYGGGLRNCNGTIENNVISSNSGYGGGGLGSCHGTIQNNVIKQNSALLLGGGLAHCDGLILNNLILGNWASESGGGLFECHGTIQNNTIVNNSATEYFGGVKCLLGTIRNCIIWGNTAPQYPQVYAAVTPSHCCIQDWGGGGDGNTSDPPGFADLAGGDYHLTEGSPCIDKGKNADWMWDATDLDGKPRVLIGNSFLTVDMGAYEYYNAAVDSEPPYAEGPEPGPGAVDVNRDTDIVLHVKDDGNGVDKKKIVVTVNDSQVSPTVTGTPSDYTLTYHPQSDFGYGETVSVAVEAQDVCSPPNVMLRVLYSFTTVAEPPDTTAPVITLLGDNPLTLEVGTAYMEPGYAASDDRDGDLTADVVVTGLVDHAVVGSYVLHYNVSDGSENPAEEKTRTVNVVDATAPTITLEGDNPVTLEVATPYVEPGYEATDNYDGDVTGNVTVTGTVGHTVLGSYLLHYNVSDSSGNPAEEKTRMVNVVDTTPPTITLEGDNPLILEAGTPYVEPGYTAADNYDGDITASVVVSGSVDHNAVGTYVLRYNVTDSSANPAEEKTRTVNVVGVPPFEIVWIAEPPPGEGTVQLTWNSRSGAAYTVWSCLDLRTGLWKEEAKLAGLAGTTTWSDSEATPTCKFYRVELK